MEGISRGSEEENRWRAEKLEATRETWAFWGSSPSAQDDPRSRWQTHLLWNRSKGNHPDSSALIDRAWLLI